MLGRALLDLQTPFKVIRSLRQLLSHLWDNLDPLNLSVPRQVEAVIANIGGNTRY